MRYGLVPAAAGLGQRIDFSKFTPVTQFTRLILRYWRSMPAGGIDMQMALAERPTTQSCERFDLSVLARQHLEHHPHFRGRVSDVFIEHRGRTLFLTGRLPTFYLKQLVQEAVRHVPGVQHVRNLIDVVSADGVSSVRC
jgi:hypothetical protein